MNCKNSKRVGNPHVWKKIKTKQNNLYAPMARKEKEVKIMLRLENLVINRDCMIVKYSQQEFASRDGGAPIISRRVAVDFGEDEDLVTFKCTESVYKKVKQGTFVKLGLEYVENNDGRKDIKVVEFLDSKTLEPLELEKEDKQADTSGVKPDSKTDNKKSV